MVYSIVSGRDRANPGPDGRKERWKIDFMQRSLINVSHFVTSPGFLIVADEMFGSGDDLLALNPSDMLGGHRTGKKRTFTERLKTATSLRHSHKVDHRPERHMNAFASVLSPNDSTVLPCQTQVPSCRQKNRRGQGSN